ncbi:2325_t:CDS:2, partial [Dentiscutata erythropus]
RFFTALVLCACVTSISELDMEELLELLSEVSELEELFVEYLTLFFLLLFLETSSFNLLNGRCVEVLKQQNVIDSCSECLIITYEIAKKLDFEKDKSLSITNKVVFDIVKQVLANPDISRQHIPCKARKKPIFNDTASESSSTSESGSSSESSNDDEDFTVKVVKAKKRD